MNRSHLNDAFACTLNPPQHRRHYLPEVNAMDYVSLRELLKTTGPNCGGPSADGIVGSSTNHPESSLAFKNYPICIADGVLCISFPEGSSPAEIAAVACEQRDRPIRWVQRKPSPSATRPGNIVNGGSSSTSDPPPNERSQSNGYVSQEF